MIGQEHPSYHVVEEHDVGYHVVDERAVFVVESSLGMGPRGPAGNAQRYPATFSNPSANWQVFHNLGYKPAVQVFDAFGALVIAEIDHTSINEFYVRFGSPQTGSVIYS